jgi:basic membrane protein A
MRHQRASICILITLLGATLTFGVVAAAQFEPQEVAARHASISVGLIPDEAGITMDNVFNLLSYQGLLRAESELGVVGTVYTPTSPTDYEPMLQQCVDDGNDLCISVGFGFTDATMNAASNNPGTDFSIVDVEYEQYTANLRGMAFSNSEAGYLAGALAGLMTESDQIGTIGATWGGIHIPSVEEFVEGYNNGAQCSNSTVEVLVEYANTFSEPELGATIAQDMIGQGADVIFAAAGPTGSGAVLTTTQSGEWAIGVDTDNYYTLFGNGAVDGSDKLLSSAMKHIDNAVFGTISDVVSDTFTSGTLVYDLALEGVGLAPFHEADPFVPQSVRDQLDLVEQGIISGTIDIADDCRGLYYLFLPLTMQSNN